VMNSEVAERTSAVFPGKQRLEDWCDKVFGFLTWFEIVVDVWRI
jgi:hypothetical protein